MKRRAMYVPAMLCLLVATTAIAHPGTAPRVATQTENVTMNGEVVDPQCYFVHDSRGIAHAACAAKCAKGGQGMSFLDDATGVVYPLIARTHGVSQNEGLLQHLGKPIQVKGVVFRKGPSFVLLIQSVVASTAKTK